MYRRLRYAPFLIGAVMLGLNMWWDLSDPNIIRSLWVAVGIFFLYALAREYELYAIRVTHSNVVADLSHYFTLEPHVVYDYRPKKKIKYKTWRYYLPLKQVQDKNVNLADTDPVYARIVYYDKNIKPLPELSMGDAFWFGDDPQVKAGQTGNKHVILKNGTLTGVCLAIKEIGKGKPLYSFNQNSYIPGREDFQFLDSMKMEGNSVFAHVFVSDGKFQSDYFVKITMRAKHDHPLFELADLPQELNSKPI